MAVSSPTPDEQAAEEPRPRVTTREQFAAALDQLRERDAAAPTDPDPLPEDVDFQANWPCPEPGDHASLVVVREQLTRLADQIEALAEVSTTDMDMGDRFGVYRFNQGVTKAAALVRAALNAPPSPPTYTTEEPRKP